MNSILIKDETTVGKIINEIRLSFEKEVITVKELISARIKDEVERYENNISNYRLGLVLPTELENRLNNKVFKKIDVEKQIYVALDAFNKNGFFILIGDEQLEELDQEVLVDESSVVTFIKLTPLVGG